MSPSEEIAIELIKLDYSSVSLSIKREDKIHEFVSGNKFRKLKYNIEAAESGVYNQLLTFGGAFSNHISATAAAGKLNNIKTIGIIRGDELNDKSNQTLKFAKQCGMQLIFVSREEYRLKEQGNLAKKYINKETFIVPEGGTNPLAIKGCEEILDDSTSRYDYICTSVGTGGTISGIINASLSHQKIIGFSALKGSFLQEDISKFVNKTNWTLNIDYHFGGYAKVTPELISFINQFKTQHNIPLDPIYTGKMMYGVLDLISKGYFKKDSKILAIHTGGLQGIQGVNTYLKKKQLPLIL
ncbi:1-aminocyclopropane-1-carboxylate deaminase/D-cysteine desulfhydrase [Aurantibacter sp.]|uniref:1-aminocyclopropane-1-carboxylate deaminase/D-cysteine desulfhydrase n=1 Tax=Aurantibacter sp. TaxID=2807103 RepID=UPI0035C804E7